MVIHINFNYFLQEIYILYKLLRWQLIDIGQDGAVILVNPHLIKALTENKTFSVRNKLLKLKLIFIVHTSLFRWWQLGVGGCVWSKLKPINIFQPKLKPHSQIPDSCENYILWRLPM